MLWQHTILVTADSTVPAPRAANHRLAGSLTSHHYCFMLLGFLGLHLWNTYIIILFRAVVSCCYEDLFTPSKDLLSRMCSLSRRVRPSVVPNGQLCTFRLPSPSPLRPRSAPPVKGANLLREFAIIGFRLFGLTMTFVYVSHSFS